MAFPREHFHAIIFHNFQRGLSRQEWFNELKSFYGDEAQSYRTVKNWFNEFNRDRRSLTNEFREARTNRKENAQTKNNKLSLFTL